jgi:hypothetical protein
MLDKNYTAMLIYQAIGELESAKARGDWEQVTQTIAWLTTEARK